MKTCFEVLGLGDKRICQASHGTTNKATVFPPLPPGGGALSAPTLDSSLVLESPQTLSSFADMTRSGSVHVPPPPQRGQFVLILLTLLPGGGGISVSRLLTQETTPNSSELLSATEDKLNP